MLSAMNIVLPRGSSLQGGFAHANITVQGATNTLISKGSIGLTKTRLVGFDLGSKMQAVAAIAGLKISPDTDFENISVDVNNGPKGTAIDNLSILAPAIGELTGAGTISPAQAIDFKMRAKLVTAGGLLARTGSKQTTVPFSIQGTSNDPKFIPDVKGLATGIATGLVERKLNTIAPGEAGKAASDLLNNLFRKKKE